MKRHHRKQWGFTLIEVLVVVAILGVLAAVVIPNVGRFFGEGQSEAAQTELHDVQLAMTAMMADNDLASVTAVTTATSDMTAFPASDPATGSPGDGSEWSLQHYLIGATTTKGTYTCTTDGTVTQVSTGY